MNKSTAPDNELMQKCKEGSTQAFETLVNRYRDRLVNFFYGLCKNRDQALDFAQEVFIKIFENRDSYKPSGKFTSYMYTIAKNHWYDYLRSSKSDHNPVSLDRSMGDSDEGFNLKSILEDTSATEPFEHLSSEKQRDILHDAIEKLPETHRMVVVLSNFEQKSHEEISEIMDIPVGTVKSRKYLAIDKLQEIIEEMRENREKPEKPGLSGGKEGS